MGSQRQLELGAEPADDVLVRVDPLTTPLDDDAVGSVAAQVRPLTRSRASKTITWWPARCSLHAQVSPARPAPTTPIRMRTEYAHRDAA